MALPEDQGYLHTLVGGMGAALAALGTWAWNHTHKRIDTVTEDSTMKETFDQHVKADETALHGLNEEIKTQRGHIAKLFDKIDEESDKTSVRFSASDKQQFERHIELLKAIQDLKPR